ncbi:Hml [Trypoxylus dichotomus]
MYKQVVFIYLLIANSYRFALANGCPNNVFNAGQNKDSATCIIWGNYNIKTFDDFGINFRSDCTFTLVSFKIDFNEFRIDVGGFNTDCRRKPGGCHTFAQIFYNNVVYKLGMDAQEQATFSTDQKSYPIPSELDGLRIHQPGYRVFIEFTRIGLVLKWDEKNMIEVTVDNDRKYEMYGLCGNRDKCSSNDQMLVNGVHTTSLERFLKEWQVDKQACPSAIETQSQCRGNKVRIQKARDGCQIIKSARFNDAHRIINPDLYIESCIWNYCSCRSPNTMDCLCGTIDAYVKASNSAGGPVIPWRDDKTCRFECIGGLQYFPCGPKGGVQTCTDVAPQDGGDKKCEEGCYCAPNTFFFGGKCYLKKKCPCMFGGRTYQPGEVMQQKCHTCTCTDGAIVCPKNPPCKVTATATGDPHYTTWDGKRFDFMGKCSYYLVKGNDFSIEADHYVWEGGKFVESRSKARIFRAIGLAQISYKLYREKRLRVYLEQGQEVELVAFRPERQETTRRRDASSDDCKDCVDVQFTECEIDDKDTMYENCVYDTCLCKEDPNKCSCDQIAMAADMCGRKKIVTNWRDKISECRLPCPAGQVYQECGNACARTCEDLSMRPDCAETCIEGCNCAPGTTMDENGQCVPVSQCKCRIDGIVYPPGFKYLKSDKELLTCENARWKRSIPEPNQQQQIPTQTQLNDKCDIDNFSVYTPCKYPAPKSCKNMHIFEITTIPVCEEGCECMDGFVLDSASQTCVRPDECPCYVNGQSYEEGGVTVQEGCNRCVCNSEGMWDCKQEDCNSLCIENEVKKVDCNTCRCKGARWECTQHDCSQQCPKEGETTKVDDCNVCTCTNGFWACTKNTCTEKCTEKNIKEDGCRICVCESGKWKCNEDNCAPQACENAGEIRSIRNGKCVCKDGVWKCVKAQCDVWGDSHLKTFDGFRFDFQGECTYALVDAKVDGVELSVLFTNERCSHAGATCLKSFTIVAKIRGVEETLTLSKKGKLPASNFKNFAITDHILSVNIEILNTGVAVFWDKKTWVYVKVNDRWRKNIAGLCGNYNNLPEDDLHLYDARSNDDPLLAFIDIWRVNQQCEPTKPNVNTCDADRRKWAETSCKVLIEPTFAPCHGTVPVDSYYEACVTDSCKCDLGGDCECLCTAISAYAQMCNNYGIPINWRTQDLCPIQCSKNTEYTSCMTTCPPKTCETIQRNATYDCEEEVLCTEGCGPKVLPPGQVYSDQNYDRPVPVEACNQKRCKDGFYEGEVTFKDKCNICVCMAGEEKCLRLPCEEDSPTTTERIIPTYTAPPPTTPGSGNLVTATTTSPSKNGITTRPPPTKPDEGYGTTTPFQPFTEDSTAEPTRVTGIIWPEVTTARPPDENDCKEVICPVLNCPAITSQVKVPGECCKSCQHETKCVVKLQYNNRLVLKKPGQKWTDGPCRECECVGEEDFTHCTSCNTKVCAKVNRRNITIGNIYYEFTKGPCCPVMEAAACIYDNKLYRIGELWDIDECTSVKCSKDPESNLPVLLTLTQVCHQECPLGFVYKKSQNTCCGKCVQDSCIVGNVVKQAGDTWESADRCTVYRCTGDNNVYQVLSRTTTCPPLPQSCPGMIKKGRCCSYCDTSELFVWEKEPKNCNIDLVPQAV